MMIQPNDYLYPWNPLPVKFNCIFLCMPPNLTILLIELSSFKPVSSSYPGGNSTSFKIIKYTNKKIHLWFPIRITNDNMIENIKKM